MTWPEVKIGSFCDTGSGGTPSRDRAAEFYGGPIPWVKSGELRESIISQTEETLTEAGLANSSAKIVLPGALLVAMYGATVGRVGILGIRAATNQAVCHILPRGQSADTRYLFHCLRAKLPVFLSRSVGGAQPNISQEIVKDTPVPLPPLEEQRRLAAVLDKADDLRQIRRAALRKLDSLVQSLFLDMFGDPVDVKHPLTKVPVSSFVSHFETGKSIAADEDENARSTLRVLKVSAVTSGEYRPEESKPVPEGYAAPSSHIVRPGDLLFSRANTSALIGATAYVSSTRENNLLPDKIWRFVWRGSGSIVPIFVWFLFRQPSVRRELAQLSSGTSGSMKNISQEKVLGMRVALPPYSEQERFARAVSLALKQRDQMRESQSVLDQSSRSLQHRAFRGEL